MIEEKSGELGRLIGQSPEYQALKRANDALTADERAKAQMKELDDLRREAQRMIAQGQRPTEEMEQKLDALVSVFQSEPAYQRLIAAQENFDKIMSKVNDWILDGIEKGAASPIIVLG